MSNQNPCHCNCTLCEDGKSITIGSVDGSVGRVWALAIVIDREVNDGMESSWQ